MNQVSVINTISVPKGMEDVAERVRDDYVNYFCQQEGFISSTFYKSISRDDDNSIKYVNTVVWASYEHFKKVVNSGFANVDGKNSDGRRVLGKGFPEPIKVMPGQYVIIAHTQT
ncbi:antibiotic biosynthesis monooxygenase [Aliiglaciecola sp. CAU 1673]|uniref:antibiotic biosynthesis monooxygenase family protein n=1 Tax=Aliiglaciecola sp. CAU 1673 TaxID=3032595 RepID=UPI0023DAF867|nr:antibiotic biosynthesis monooxygenase [Aliiglaciecola sp. CAU 1673]MDF2180029.1 antibiotic biosynthesis monooxygenase [Aliiglaciecola sp. CAU 1673]